MSQGLIFYGNNGTLVSRLLGSTIATGALAGTLHAREIMTLLDVVSDDSLLLSLDLLHIFKSVLAFSLLISANNTN